MKARQSDPLVKWSVALTKDKQAGTFPRNCSKLLEAENKFCRTPVK